MLVVVSRSGQGLILERQLKQELFRVVGMGNTDFPRLSIRSLPEGAQVATGIDKSSRNTSLLPQGFDPVSGVALTDRGQADAHAFLVFSKVVGGAEVELVPTHAFEHFF